MTKHIYFLICGLVVFVSANGQTPLPEYHSLIRQADSLYKAKDYRNSGLKFSAAFKTFGWLGYENHRYDAACSWAMAGNPDSAFYNLQRIVDRLNFSEYNKVIEELDFKGLHGDTRWAVLVLQIKQKKEKKKKIEEGHNIPLFHLIDSMVLEDQKWRNYHAKYINKELSTDTISEKAILRYIKHTDSLNYFIIKDIFTMYGYPNYDLVGEKGSNNYWLLVQHQDKHPAFQDSVLSKMKIEVGAKKVSSRDYAYLVDRVKVNTHQLQVYGTQMILNSDKTSYVPKPTMDPSELNKRRQQVDLPPIEDYIKDMNERYYGDLKK